MTERPPGATDARATVASDPDLTPTISSKENDMTMIDQTATDASAAPARPRTA